MKHTFGIYATLAYLFGWRRSPARARPRLAPAAHAARSPGDPDVEAADRLRRHERAGTVSFAVRTEHRVWGRDARGPSRARACSRSMLLVAYLRRAERPRPAARRRRPRAARADDALVRQRDRHERPEHRGRRRPRAARPARRDAPLPGRGAGVGPLERRRRRPEPLPPAHRPARAAAPPAHRAAPARLDRAARSAGGSRSVRPPGWALYFKGGWGSGSGAVDHQVALLRRGDAPDRGGDHDHLEPEPRLREGARSRGWRGGCCAASGRPRFRRARPGIRLRRHGPHPLAVRRGLPRRAAGLARRQPPG